jgi:DNA repair protein RecO (recombination protein O)
MAIRTTEAIVLKTRPFRNSSLIVTAYTRDFGKIQGLAKGIKLRCDRKDTRHHCYLEPLTLDKIVYYEKSRSGLHLLTQSDLLNQFEQIRNSLAKLAAASFMLELVDKGTQLEDVNRGIFELLTGSLGRLCKSTGGLKEILLFFQTQFLRLSGFMPKDNRLGMPIVDYIRLHIDSEFKTLEFMEKIRHG